MTTLLPYNSRDLLKNLKVNCCDDAAAAHLDCSRLLPPTPEFVHLEVCHHSCTTGQEATAAIIT